MLARLRGETAKKTRVKKFNARRQSRIKRSPFGREKRIMSVKRHEEKGKNTDVASGA